MSQEPNVNWNSKVSAFSTQQFYKINGYNRWSMIVSSGLMALTLAIAWLLWFIFFQSAIKHYIETFNLAKLSKLNIKFNFAELSVLSFSIIGASGLLVIVPMIFLKSKSGISTLFSLLIFIFATIVIINFVSFMSITANAVEFLLKNDKSPVNTLGAKVAIFLPWGFVMFFALVLWGNSIWLAITGAAKYKSTSGFAWQQPAMAKNSMASAPLQPHDENIIIPTIRPIAAPSTNSLSLSETDPSQPVNVTQSDNYFSQPQIHQGGFEVQQENQTEAMIEAQNNQTSFTSGGGYLWTPEQVQVVWAKAEIITGVNDKLYRKDYAGAWMFRDSFKNTIEDTDNTKTYSWTIVLHRPLSQGGTIDSYNLDPMNVINAKAKGEDYPRWRTQLSSKENENVVKEQVWKARS